ncbi:MAG: hypothetical protein K2X04_07930 [Burkholderiales bacterium]|nr:hypothetical protein [Burkholderiales bacterium]
MKKLYLIVPFVAMVPLFLNACGSGSSAPLQQLTVTSANGNNTFAANIDERALITYQLSLQTSPQGQKYTANVSLPNNQFSVESNGCINFYDTSGCNIVIKFSPTDKSAYSNNNVLQFSVGTLSSSITAITTPR